MIVIFDVEGVLVDGEFLPELAKLVDRDGEVADITDKGIKGEINWSERLERRIRPVEGTTYAPCVSVAERLPLMNGAKEMISQFRKTDCTLVGVSGGFSLLTDRVRQELGLDYAFSNELVFHKGMLVGYALLVNANKKQILRNAFGSMLRGQTKVAVVDGANDLDLFSLVNYRVAFNAQKVVVDQADISITEKDLRLIPKALAKTGNIRNLD